MRKLVLLVALALLIALLAAKAGLLQHWLAFHLGLLNLSGPQYGWWSGAGSDVQEYVELPVGAALMWWHHTCHDPRCLRLARHPSADGAHRFCWRHHPDNRDGSKRPSREHMHAKHHAARARQEAS